MQEFIAHHQARINSVLLAYLPDENTIPITLHRAMHYSIFGGGKRIRALLVYATGEAFTGNIELLDIAAAAIELVHGYSLIHDDLPAMDNDDLRHGKPSCHIAFNEAIAILTGDALQSLAFEILASKEEKSTKLTAEQRISMIATLAHAIGSVGMAGGQTLDLEAENKTIDLTQLEQIHRYKTGALIIASVRMGALASGCNNISQLKNLEAFAACIGLAFQIRDDILDVESTTEILGKTQGADASHHKATYPALIGLDASKKRANELYQQGLEYLNKTGISFNSLRDLANYIINRQY